MMTPAKTLGVMVPLGVLNAADVSDMHFASIGVAQAVEAPLV